MALEKITTVSGRAIHVPGADIDTDRIIPARFMKCVTFDGLGEYAFYDVRFDPDTGEKTDHPLNDPRFNGATILLTGVNFGCGSSREHAPQSLSKYGFKAVIAQSFAEIFFGNSTTLGMPCVTLGADEIAQLRDAVEADPSVEITIDLEQKKVRSSAGHEFPCDIPESARDALTAGRWDPIQELLDNSQKISATAEALPYV
jgi:3-isopropylmalate/(R)-2-methylmalate dehydratase small subunit